MRLSEWQKKMLLQKLTGIMALLACIIILIFAMNGKKPEDTDVTPVLLIAPLGFGLLLSKESWF